MGGPPISPASLTDITRKFLGSCRQMVRQCEAEDRRNFTTRLAMRTSDTVCAFKCCAKIDADPEASGRLSLATQLILYTSEQHPVRASCLSAVSHAKIQGEVSPECSFLINQDILVSLSDSSASIAGLSFLPLPKRNAAWNLC